MKNVQGRPNLALSALEGVLVGAVGAGLGWGTAWLVLRLLPIAIGNGIGLIIMVAVAAVSGLNGVIGGAAGVYAWVTPIGGLSFLADSTWGVVGTATSDLLQILSPFFPGRVYHADLSRRQNRHLYEGGFGLGGIALTLGNVTRLPPVSGFPPELVSQLVRHETLHITQNRLFGPIFQATFVVWLAIGILVGCILGLFVKQPLAQSIADVAYYDNPWETWAWRTYGPEVGKRHGGLLSWA